MDTSDAVSDGSTQSMEVGDKQRDVMQPSTSTEALNATSKDDKKDMHLVEDELLAANVEMKRELFSLQPHGEQASDQTAMNNEIVEVLACTPERFFSIILDRCKGKSLFPSAAPEIPPSVLLPPTATAIPPSSLLLPLRNLGMSHAISEDRLTQILHSSGYLDANAQLDCDHFLLFESDCRLLQAVQMYYDNQHKPAGTGDLGRLPDFFKILQEPSKESGLKASDFVNAFNALEMNLTSADGYSLERYSRLRAADPQDFERFVRKLHCPLLARGRTVNLDKNQSLHRMMLFVSVYTRAILDVPSSSSAESGVCCPYCCKF